MTNQNNLPNFLIVGAAKSGTTSIASYLQNNPQVFISAIKEPHHFIADQVKQSVQKVVASDEEYTSLFAQTDAAARGEASVFYLYFHEVAIPKIIAKLGRDTKIIILLRNPVERAYSAYNFASALNAKENLNFPEALTKESERVSDPKVSPMLHYVRMGLYSEMVKAYLDAFPNCHIELFDDVKKDVEAMVGRLEDFLSVPRSSKEDFQVLNRGGLQWKYPFIGGVIKWTSSKSDFLKQRMPWLRSGFRYCLRKVLQTKTSPMDQQSRKYLENAFRDDVQKLAKLIDRNLDHWLPDDPNA